MPNATALRLPTYRRHKPTGQAVVTLNGKDHYLGKWNSKPSRAEYDRLIGEWLAAGRCPPKPQHDLTIAELALRYWRYADAYYRKDGEPTGSHDRIKVTLRILRQSYAHTLAADFGPLALQAIQGQLAASGRCRRYCNYLIDTIRRVFKWGVAQQLVPETVYRALLAVPGLRRGRTEASEPAPVLPVDDDVIDATLPYLPPIAADMVRLQRLIGARPAEVCIMRPCDIDTSSAATWVYAPASHKTDYHGHKRIIFIGPKAQDVLRKYLLREKDAYCFVPAQGERKRNAQRRADRHSPMTPSQARRRAKRNRRRAPGDRYAPHSYYYAVRRAVEKANKDHERHGSAARIPAWHPNQLRHSAATEIRKHFGLEAVQAVLGHKNMIVSEVYAEKNLALAAQVMQKIG